jgi:hypothetical protein
MARQARKQMADMRALAVNAEKDNIIDPRKPTANEMLTGGGGVVGGGATPSMGLSQVRGGVLSLLPGRRGREKSNLAKLAERQSAPAPAVSGGAARREAKEMGAHLHKYLTKIHGKGYARAFHRGMGAVDSDSDSASDDESAQPHGGNISKSGAFEGEGHHHDHYEGEGRTYAQVEAKRARNEGAMEMARANATAQRKGAGPNDGRRKRAEVVKKVMREKGLSMIDASKYVKLHNLYSK